MGDEEHVLLVNGDSVVIINYYNYVHVTANLQPHHLYVYAYKEMAIPLVTRSVS